MNEPITKATSTTPEVAISEVGIVLAIDGHEPATYQEALDHCAIWNLFDKEVRRRLLYKALIKGAEEGVSRNQVFLDLPKGFMVKDTFYRWIKAAPEKQQEKFPPAQERPEGYKKKESEIGHSGGARPLVKSDQNSEEQPAAIVNSDNPEESLASITVLPTTTYDHENTKLTAFLAGSEGPRSHTPVYLKVGNKGDEAYRELVFNGKDLTGDERLSLRCLFGGCLEETGIPRQAIHEFLSQYEER